MNLKILPERKTRLVRNDIMEDFLRIVRKKKILYALLISIFATMLFVNSIVEFGEIIIKSKYLLGFSVLVFCCLSVVAIKNEVWKDEQQA